METEQLYLIQSGNYRYSRFASDLEDAKRMGDKIAREFGGAEIYTIHVVKGSCKLVLHVRPSIEFVEPRKEEEDA